MIADAAVATYFSQPSQAVGDAANLYPQMVAEQSLTSESCEVPRCLVGISASDFHPERGHIALEIYRIVDFVEYGGYSPPVLDSGMLAYWEDYPNKTIGRHLVTTDLLTARLRDKDARQILKDVEGARVEYFVTDFGFWRLGRGSLLNLWFRPCVLSREAARRIAANVSFLQDRVGKPLFIENPFAEYFEGELDITDFLNVLADHGVCLCLDIGHFIAAYHNRRTSAKTAFARLPFEAIQMSHVAGLSSVSYEGKSMLLDNHNVSPGVETIDCLERLLKRARLQRVTYEAELASTDVQLAGLYKLGRFN